MKRPAKKKQTEGVLDAIMDQLRSHGEDIDVETLINPPRAPGSIGRPPIAPEDRREAVLKVLVTKAEQEEIRRAADAAGVGVSMWLRLTALEKARALGGSQAEPRGPSGQSKAPPRGGPRLL